METAAAERLNSIKQGGGRIIPVGTTSHLLLESAARPDGLIDAFEGDTRIFITPGYSFRAIDGLMTNFHLPRSTLFMLVSALMGRERMQQIYAHAIRSEEHTSELQSLMRISYAVFCLKKKTKTQTHYVSIQIE